MDIAQDHLSIRLTGPLNGVEENTEKVTEETPQQTEDTKDVFIEPILDETEIITDEESFSESQAPRIDDQPESGHEVDSEDQPDTAEEKDPPALRRLGLS